MYHRAVQPTNGSASSGDASEVETRLPEGVVQHRVDDASLSTIPDFIGTYQIIGLLGSGGMGVVYEAIQARPRRKVALKIIRADRVREDMSRRLSVEAEALGRLQHPAIAQIYEAGTTTTNLGTQLFLALELIDGLPLDVHLAQNLLSLRDTVKLAIKIADAVGYAHRHGVIHRDLKPRNIFITTSGEPKVLDFGLALFRDTDFDSQLCGTDIGKLAGTLQYMSPEQADGDSRGCPSSC